MPIIDSFTGSENGWAVRQTLHSASGNARILTDSSAITLRRTPECSFPDALASRRHLEGEALGSTPAPRGRQTSENFERGGNSGGNRAPRVIRPRRDTRFYERYSIPAAPPEHTNPAPSINVAGAIRCKTKGPALLQALPCWSRQIGGSIIIIVIVVPRAVPIPPARTSADVARSYVDVAADVRTFLRVGADGPGFGDRERGRDS